MALGFASATAQSILNAFGNQTAYTGATNLYMKLHTAAPGTGGTAAAAETRRMEVTFGTASGGSMANDQTVTWTTIVGTETATHFSLWNNATDGAGTFLASGTLTANPYTAGDTLNVAVGAATVTLSVAS